MGLAGTHGHARRLAAQFQMCLAHWGATPATKVCARWPLCVAYAGGTVTPSLASEGVKGSSWENAVRRRGPGWRGRDGPWKQSQSARGALSLADGKLDGFVVGEPFAPSERVRVLKVERGADYRR